MPSQHAQRGMGGASEQVRTTPRHRQQSTDTKRGVSITDFEQTEAGLLFTFSVFALQPSNRFSRRPRCAQTEAALRPAQNQLAIQVQGSLDTSTALATD